MTETVMLIILSHGAVLITFFVSSVGSLFGSALGGLFGWVGTKPAASAAFFCASRACLVLAATALPCSHPIRVFFFHRCGSWHF